MSILRCLFFIILGAALSGAAVAGPNAGGVLDLHDANLAFTTDTSNYCGLGTAPDSCGAIDVNLESSDGEHIMVWKAYAAFPSEASPRLKGLTFGVHYNPSDITITAYGACIGDLDNGAAELRGAGWPGNDTGTSIVFQHTQTAHMVELYWFAGYDYSGDPALFELRAHPDSLLGGTFGDDDTPSVLDTIADFGSLGFGTDGSIVCPESAPGGNGPLGGNTPDSPEPEGDTTPPAPGELTFVGLSTTDDSTFVSEYRGSRASTACASWSAWRPMG